MKRRILGLLLAVATVASVLLMTGCSYNYRNKDYSDELSEILTKEFIAGIEAIGTVDASYTEFHEALENGKLDEYFKKQTAASLRGLSYKNETTTQIDYDGEEKTGDDIVKASDDITLRYSILYKTGDADDFKWLEASNFMNTVTGVTIGEGKLISKEFEELLIDKALSSIKGEYTKYTKGDLKWDSEDSKFVLEVTDKDGNVTETLDNPMVYISSGISYNKTNDDGSTSSSEATVSWFPSQIRLNTALFTFDETNGFSLRAGNEAYESIYSDEVIFYLNTMYKADMLGNVGDDGEVKDKVGCEMGGEEITQLNISFDIDSSDDKEELKDCKFKGSMSAAADETALAVITLDSVETSSYLPSALIGTAYGDKYKEGDNRAQIEIRYYIEMATNYSLEAIAEKIVSESYEDNVAFFAEHSYFSGAGIASFYQLLKKIDGTFDAEARFTYSPASVLIEEFKTHANNTAKQTYDNAVLEARVAAAWDMICSTAYDKLPADEYPDSAVDDVYEQMINDYKTEYYSKSRTDTFKSYLVTTLAVADYDAAKEAVRAEARKVVIEKMVAMYVCNLYGIEVTKDEYKAKVEAIENSALYQTYLNYYGIDYIEMSGGKDAVYLAMYYERATEKVYEMCSENIGWEFAESSTSN